MRIYAGKNCHARTYMPRLTGSLFKNVPFIILGSEKSGAKAGGVDLEGNSVRVTVVQQGAGRGQMVVRERGASRVESREPVTLYMEQEAQGTGFRRRGTIEGGSSETRRDFLL